MQSFAIVFQKKCSRNFRNTHRKTGVLQFLLVFFFFAASLQVCNFIKKRLQRWCFPVNIMNFFKNTFFYRALPVAASSD